MLFRSVSQSRYHPDDNAQHIYETRLDDFFNCLATELDIYEVMWCMFDEAKEYKHCQQVSVFIKRSQWKQHVFRLLDAGNAHAWLLLTEYSKSEWYESEWAHAASKADDLR